MGLFSALTSLGSKSSSVRSKGAKDAQQGKKTWPVKAFAKAGRDTKTAEKKK